MRFPFYIGTPGKLVPRWLETVGPTPGKEAIAVMGDLRFSCYSIVWRKSDQYFVRPMFAGSAGAMKLSDGARGLTISGQSPNNSGKPVCFIPVPLVPDWVFGVAVVWIVAWLFR